MRHRLAGVPYPGGKLTVLERVDRELPFSCEQIFDLVADVERYPEFVPLWISARVLRRGFNTVDVEQSLGFGPICLTFSSHTVLQRPVRIDVLATGPLFGQYQVSMAFSARAAAACLVSIESELSLASPFLQQIRDRAMPGFFDRVAEAFVDRATFLYGRPSAAAPHQG